MTKNELESEYFSWMGRIICGDMGNCHYNKLLRFLHNTDFNYIIDMDGNRADDGINLRYRFGYEQGYESPMIASLLDNRPCSVLEMMVALALRCEEQIMEDSDVGDRLGKWFWGMISNLGLLYMDDFHFNAYDAERIIFRLLDREYEPDGSGGLFKLKNRKYDLRTVEIWYQLCWYLDEILNE